MIHSEDGYTELMRWNGSTFCVDGYTMQELDPPSPLRRVVFMARRADQRQGERYAD